MQENVKPRVAVWHWSKSEPVPDAKVVVCEPGLFPLRDSASRQAWDWIVALCAYRTFVLAEPQWQLDKSDFPSCIIPALHVRTQSDLAHLPDLLAVKAERRALVCSPEEAIDCGALQMRARCSICARDNVAIAMGIVCAKCPRVDVVFIVGFDKPMHPDWIRGIVEQCRVAGVPVVLATWGEWAHRSQYPEDTIAHWFQDGHVTEWGGLVFDGSMVYRVGSDRSGTLLDGAKVEDWPDWMGVNNASRE